MSARVRLALAVVGLTLLAVGVVASSPRRFLPDAPLVATAALADRGAAFAERHCARCHAERPFAPRVRGWDVERAYRVLGNLPEVPPGGMPPFPGDDDDRRAVAAWLVREGGGEVR